MPRSCFLPDIACSAEERVEAERLCRAEGVDPRGMTTWTWTYPDGSKRSMDREEWVAYLDAARALMRARWPRDRKEGDREPPHILSAASNTLLHAGPS